MVQQCVCAHPLWTSVQYEYIRWSIVLEWNASIANISTYSRFLNEKVKRATWFLKPQVRLLRNLNLNLWLIKVDGRVKPHSSCSLVSLVMFSSSHRDWWSSLSFAVSLLLHVEVVLFPTSIGGPLTIDVHGVHTHTSQVSQGVQPSWPVPMYVVIRMK